MNLKLKTNNSKLKTTYLLKINDFLLTLQKKTIYEFY